MFVEFGWHRLRKNIRIILFEIFRVAEYSCSSWSNLLSNNLLNFNTTRIRLVVTTFCVKQFVVVVLVDPHVVTDIKNCNASCVVIVVPDK
jgi:hypothetical protein